MNNKWCSALEKTCKVLLLLAVIVSLFTTYYSTEYFLDGDASSELVLAEHLAREGKLLSEDWYYSTELRVVNTQLVYVPLFCIFGDWHMVRFVGAIVMQMMLAVSLWWITSLAGCSRSSKCIGASLAILPFSISYGRIVLYHTYYMPHIILGFLIVALYLSALRNRGRRQHIYLALMSVVSFLSGLGGIRQFVITQAPLLLICLYAVFHKGNRISFAIAVKEHAAELIMAVICILAFVSGFLVNDKVLGKLYWFRSYSGTEFDLNNFNKLPDIVFGFLHQFGFRRNVKVISIVGIATMFGLFAGVYMLWQGVCSAGKCDNGMPCEKRILQSFFAVSMLTTVGVSLLTGSADAYTRYMIPAAIWAIVLLCIQCDRVMSNIGKMDSQCVCTLLAVLALAGNAFVNAGYYSGHTIGFRQIYEGLYENEKLVEQLQGPLEAIRQKGYTVGYGTRWESCTVTEMEDGKITVIPVVFSEDHSRIEYEKWLSLRSYQELEPERTFILFPSYLDKYYAKLQIEEFGEKIYHDDIYTVYGIERAEALISYLRMNELDSWM